MLKDQNEVIYSIAGRFEKLYSNHYFYPTPPIQVIYIFMNNDNGN